MKKHANIDEKEIFLKNISNIVMHLKLSKSKFNKKLGWPTNKLSNILANKQEPLLKDIKCMRRVLGLTTTDLLTRTLNKSEIDRLKDRTTDIKLVRNISITTNPRKPMSYIIVLLYKTYNLKSEFTKKEIINSLPKEFSEYSIEWKKTRLKAHIEKAGERINTDNSTEYTFRLIKKLPSKMVEQALLDVGDDWLGKH